VLLTIQCHLNDEVEGRVVLYLYCTICRMPSYWYSGRGFVMTNHYQFSFAVRRMYNEYRVFHECKLAGVWCRTEPSNFSDVEEGRIVLYLYCTMSTVSFVRVKQPGHRAEQNLQYLVKCLKEELCYTSTAQ
jgi:hypothetical protein